MTLQKREVIVLHTNDIHSHLNNVTKLDTMINKIRNEYDKDVILVDLGDFMDRMSIETEGTNGLIHRELLNYMKYDVITLGNNECLTFTQEQLTNVYQAPTTFKVVCCNMKPVNDKQFDWLLKSTVIEKNGLKIAFIGATINYTDFYMLLNWNAQDPIQAIQDEVSKLKGRVDVIIVLSHLGIKLDEQLVNTCHDIDILIGAHTHHVFDPALTLNDTLMCAGGMGGQYLGMIKISPKPNCNSLKFEGKLIPSIDIEPSTSVQAIINQHHELALTQLNQVVTTLDTALHTDDFMESSLPNLLAISLKTWCNTSLAIVNSGQLLHGLPKGEVTLKDLHEICPSPINPCVLHIKGEYIKLALEQSLLNEYRGKQIKGYGFRGKRLGYLAISGFMVKYKKNTTNNDYFLQIFINDELLNVDEIYKIASIDMFTFKHGYKSLSEYESVQYFVPDFIRHLLAVAIQNKQLIEESKQLNWIDTTLT